ncbi:MAG: hypothetical protein U1F65_05860 [Verrucomicrobiota bacterium]
MNLKPITIKTVVSRVNRVLARSERSIRDDMAALGIANVGQRQRPQRYPHDTAERVLSRLGMSATVGGAK